jgi:hypothetical protein
MCSIRAFTDKSMVRDNLCDEVTHHAAAPTLAPKSTQSAGPGSLHPTNGPRLAHEAHPALPFHLSLHKTPEPIPC